MGVGITIREAVQKSGWHMTWQWWRERKKPLELRKAKGLDLSRLGHQFPCRGQRKVNGSEVRLRFFFFYFFFPLSLSFYLYFY